MASLMGDLPVSSAGKDNTTLNPPSPLMTEVDEDENGGPSSVEAQADPSDLSFDLELDLVDVPASTYPLMSPQPTTSTDVFEDNNGAFAGLFDTLDNPESGQGEAGVKIEGAVAGICGFYNFANTCYMNSGLQCLLATPTVVKYFTTDEDLGVGKEGLVAKFRPLLQDVWAGDYNLLKPVDFKECLSLAHAQFAGAQQHDCQEFLALLLDAMHEELRQLRKAKNGNKAGNAYESECGTSMELHTPHSTEKEAALSMGWLSRDSSVEDNSNAASTSLAPISSTKKSSVHQDVMQDGTESRGSASPKSYDSHASSVEDKVTTAIRQLPIPKTLKAKNMKTGASSDEDSGQGDESMEDDDVASFNGHDDDCDTMDSNQTWSDSNHSSVQPTSNLVAPDSLKRNVSSCNAVRFSDDNVVINNNSSAASVKGEDFYQKENKTLNVNVLAEETAEMNNELSFDSGKFSKHEAKARPKETIDSLVGRSEAAETHSSDSLSTRAASASTHKVTNVNKRFNNDDANLTADTSSKTASTALSSIESETICDFNAIKRIRLDSSEKEKNVQHEMERQSTSIGAPSMPPVSSSLDPARLKEAIEADRYWEKYLAVNDTVLARTFQGQFKSSVTCGACNYVSVSFEPFMYLPVPLPDANVKQVEVTFVDGQQPRPRKLLLDMCHTDNVGCLKEKLAAEVAATGSAVPANDKLQLVEVVDHHIARLVDDWMMLKALKDGRQVYVVRVLSLGSDVENDENACDNVDDNAGDAVVPQLDSEPSGQPAASAYQSCVICMEDLPADELRQHNACDCVMCMPCLERTLDHHKSDASLATGHIKCPGCRGEAEADVEFVRLDEIGKSKPKIRMLNLPVVSRMELPKADDQTGRKRVVNFGHPTLVSVPNVTTGRALHQLLGPLMLPGTPSTHLALVNAQGKLCSRCIFNARCNGCVLVHADSDQEVLLQVNDTVAITYVDPAIDVAVANAADNHESMTAKTRVKDRLSLEDCLEAFSRPEVLDESNPWFCPMCRKYQCATKTLTVWRFPDYLIVYLKRFVYMNTGAIKLEKDVDFRTDGLDLTPFLSGPLQPDGRPVFNMYGCVCHFGSVYGGHYTSFAKHIGSNQWNYFDDGTISPHKVPGDAAGDNSSAYILFYQRAGSRQDNQIPLLNRKCRAFAMGSSDKDTQKLMSVDNVTDTKDAVGANDDQPMASCGVSDDVSTSQELDDEEDESLENPDLLQIIRSLDTPPPS